MTKAAVKFIVAGTVLVAAFAYLAYAGLKDGFASYHLQVDEFTADPQYRTQRVRLAGRVAEAGLVEGPGQLGAQFKLEGAKTSLAIAYKGVLPDLFEAGCEIVAEGRLDQHGTFNADLLMTKCASKYESEAKPGHGSAKQTPRS